MLKRFLKFKNVLVEFIAFEKRCQRRIVINANPFVKKKCVIQQVHLTVFYAPFQALNIFTFLQSLKLFLILFTTPQK